MSFNARRTIAVASYCELGTLRLHSRGPGWRFGLIIFCLQVLVLKSLLLQCVGFLQRSGP